MRTQRWVRALVHSRILLLLGVVLGGVVVLVPPGTAVPYDRDPFALVLLVVFSIAGVPFSLSARLALLLGVDVLPNWQSDAVVFLINAMLFFCADWVLRKIIARPNPRERKNASQPER